MKKRMIIIAFCVFAGMSAFSQIENDKSELEQYFGSVKKDTKHEIRTNFIDFIVRGYSIGYEMDTKEYQSIGIIIRRISRSNLITDYKRVDIVPEYRLYFSPNLNPNRNFAAPYIRYSNIVNIGDYNIYNQTSNSSQTVYNVKATTQRVAFGISFGRKWSNPTGLTFETMLALGREISENTKFDNPSVAAEQSSKRSSGLETLGTIDLRVGFNIGYRF